MPFGSLEGQAVVHIELEAAVRVHMVPDQRRQGCPISGRKFVSPL